MAHGFAAESSFRLPVFAQRFVHRGLAVFLFDYRNFGGSDGQPRNLVNPSRHLQDWQAALAHVRSLSGINRDRIALWGTSFSGGHVIVTAARDQGVSAVVAQVPFVDGLASAKTFKKKYLLQAVLYGLRDLARKITLRDPYRVPVVGAPESFAVMNGEDAASGYLALVPESTSWKNECPARGLLSTTFYRPISLAHKVNCPALVLFAEKDLYIPASAVEKAAARMSQAEAISLPLGHFDVYVGDAFEKVVEHEAGFLEKHLNVTCPPTGF